jgi:thiol:disulfide interchange protein DsbC
MFKPVNFLSRLAATGAAALVLCAPLLLSASHAEDKVPNASVPNASEPKNATPIKIGPEINIAHLVESRLKPGTKVESVTKAPFFGLYEVRVGSDILYTDENVNYLFAGSVYDTKTMTNLTEERVAKLTTVRFEDLPFKDSIKLVNGTGKRQIAYFSDPNCPYCKQYEKNLTQIKDTTVYVFLYAILGDDSVKKAKTLWCAPDRAKAWNDWMLRGQMASTPACDSPIDSNRALGERLNVRATPTTILSNGERVPGAIPIAQLQKAIADAGL